MSDLCNYLLRNNSIILKNTNKNFLHIIYFFALQVQRIQLILFVKLAGCARPLYFIFKIFFDVFPFILIFTLISSPSYITTMGTHYNVSCPNIYMYPWIICYCLCVLIITWHYALFLVVFFTFFPQSAQLCDLFMASVYS